MKRRLLFFCMLLSIMLSKAFAQTTTINGLVVVVNFKDYKLKASMAELDDMFNKPTGFNLWSNESSVREYFKAQTNNKIDLVNTIISVDLDANSDYYVAAGAPGDLITDVISAIETKYPEGFSGLTVHPTQGRLYNFSIISQSANGAGVAWETNATIDNNGSPMLVKNVSHVSWTQNYAYDINTICHEYGHSVWNWTDYYQTAFCNLGKFDLMSSAGSEKGPMPINPALRIQRGWVDTITNIPGTVTATYTLMANSYSRVYKYANPSNPKEYLLFHALKHDKFYQSSLHGSPMPEGLAIWYVDEETGFGMPGQDNQFFIRLVQADNLDQMHDEDAHGHIGGDINDLYGNANKSFPNGHPWRWKDGGDFGINISNITKFGNTVSFTVNGRSRTVLANTDQFGTVTPKGVLNITGTSQTFTFLPDPGYELAAIEVDGSSVTTTNPYTLSNINGTRSIYGYFARKTTIPALPLPWQKAHIGVTGIAVEEANAFSLEADGGSLNQNADNFTYVYRSLNGDGSIIAQVTDMNRPARNLRAGIMIRESLSNNAAFASLVKIPFAAQKVIQRKSTGSGLEENPNGVANLHLYNLYHWLKITRIGNEFTSYCSRDGITWIPIGLQTIDMPDQVYIGLCVAGGGQYFPAKATFDNVSIDTTANYACTFEGAKISGNSIGTEGSWGNSGNTRDKAYDGSIFNYFDAPVNQAWTGISLGSDYKVNGIRFFPRRGETARMVGGKFQGSNTADFSSGVVDLAIINTAPVYDWNCISVSHTDNFKYLRYLSPVDGYGNVSEIEFYGTAIPTCAFNGTIISGISIGSEGSWSNSGHTRDKVFDGSITTFFDGATGEVWTGLSLDSNFTISGIAFYPREAHEERMIGGKFQGSNTADFSSGVVDLATVTSQPALEWNCVQVNNSGSFKYLRYLGPANGFGNVSEVVFYGTSTANEAPIVTITNPSYGASYTAPTNIIITANATDQDGSIWKVEFYQGDTLLGEVLSAPYTLTVNNLSAGTYSFTAIAYDNLTATSNFTVSNITVSNNNAVPIVSIATPSTGTTFAGPANITIEALATDSDGTVSMVEFYNGSTLLGSLNSAPYTYAWSNVNTGTYSITVIAYDNNGATASSTVNNITVNASTGPISGPVCGTNNTVVQFELTASHRVNATSYNWYYTGSAQSIAPVTGSAYKVNITTGSNFGAGQICVGVNYSSSPWYSSYCKTVTECSGAREGAFDLMEINSQSSIKYQNPFTEFTTINFGAYDTQALVQVYDAGGILLQETVESGAFRLGEKLKPGLYLVRINFVDKSEIVKLIKL